VALSQKHRSTIYQRLEPILGEEEAEALLGQFPAHDLDEVATKEFVRAEITGVRGEMSELRVEIASVRTEIAELRTEMHQLVNRLFVVLTGVMVGVVGIALAVARA
jgi:hypothetical protein